MKYTVGFKHQFSVEFGRYPKDQQDLILDFIALFQAHGLDDFTKYPGKVAPSWGGLQANHPNFSFAQSNHLWHYHMGYPAYVPGPKYQTSDWVIHFQWPGKGAHIDLVDCYQHQNWQGKFYMPPAGNLTPAPPAPTSTDTAP